MFLCRKNGPSRIYYIKLLFHINSVAKLAYYLFRDENQYGQKCGQYALGLPLQMKKP